MVGRLINLVANGFFIVMLALVVRKDLLVAYYAGMPPSYRSVLQDLKEPEVTKMAIYMLGERKGVSETVIEPLAGGIYRIGNRTTIKDLLGGGGAPVEISSSAIVDAAYQLESFVVEIDFPLLESRIVGNVEGDTIFLTSESNGVQYHESIPFDSNSTMSNGLSCMLTMPELEVGKEWNINMINPLTMRVEPVIALVESREKTFWNGQEVDSFRVVMKDGGMRFNSWVSLDGKVLRESGPLGVTLIREE